MRMSEELAQAIVDLKFFESLEIADCYLHPEFPGFVPLTNRIKELLCKEFPNPDVLYLVKENQVYVIKWDGSNFTIEVKQPAEVNGIKKVMIFSHGSTTPMYVVGMEDGEILLSLNKKDANPIKLDSIYNRLGYLQIRFEEDNWVQIESDLPMPLKA